MARRGACSASERAVLHAATLLGFRTFKQLLPSMKRAGACEQRDAGTPLAPGTARGPRVSMTPTCRPAGGGRTRGTEERGALSCGCLIGNKTESRGNLPSKGPEKVTREPALTADSPRVSQEALASSIRSCRTEHSRLGLRGGTWRSTAAVTEPWRQRRAAPPAYRERRAYLRSHL